MSRSTTALAIVIAGLLLVSVAGAESAPFCSPFDLAFSPDGKTLVVSDRSTSSAAVIDVGGARLLGKVALKGQATGVAWEASGDSFFVAEYGAGTVAQVDRRSIKVMRRLEVGLRPMGLAVVPGRSLLIAANTVTDDVSVVDLASGRERARIRVPREPFFIAVTPDASLAVVGNLLPSGSAAEPTLAAVVSLLDLERLEHLADVRLPAGSTSVREVAVSRDGRWAYVVHTLGRFNVPTTQLERGWVNTNALSVIDLASRGLHATVLLDHPSEGATDPWGLALARDASKLWISLRGVHELARVDLAGLHRYLEGELPESLAVTAAYDVSTQNIWSEIKRDPKQRELLMNDLGALHVADLIKSFPLSGNGPRGLDLSPDGLRLAAAMYFSGDVLFVDAQTGEVSSTVSLCSPREPDRVRRGEMLFHDATICFQRWLSCATCHPDEARTDGLRWDLPNDGLGTPQRTRSLLLSHKIRPMTARGVRGSIEESVPKGLRFFLRMPEPDLVEPLLAYLRSIEREPSPYLVDGKLSPAAQRGKALFEKKANCAGCHPGELGTDLKAHDVGTRGEFDRPDDVFYTPKLIELYRSRPFLHDGRAANLMDVFTLHDLEKRHGKASRLSRQELEDLVEYLKSL